MKSGLNTDLSFLRGKPGETQRERHTRLRIRLLKLSPADRELLEWLLQAKCPYDEVLTQFELMLAIQSGNAPQPERAKNEEKERNRK